MSEEMEAGMRGGKSQEEPDNEALCAAGTRLAGPLPFPRF